MAKGRLKLSTLVRSSLSFYALSTEQYFVRYIGRIYTFFTAALRFLYRSENQIQFLVSDWNPSIDLYPQMLSE